ncbi:unnamed protein product, partial [Rotaria socialis]
MEQQEFSIDHPDEHSNDDEEEELWLSGHRSIFSSYENDCRQLSSSFHNSQYEGFHWD